MVKNFTDEKIRVCSHPSPGLITGSSNVTIDEIMIGQSRYSAAVQLVNSPSMKFGSDLTKYVQFVTMFRNTFEDTIKNSLFDILVRHVFGQAKKGYWNMHFQ